MDNNLIRLVAFILVTIGALNWGMVGIFNINLVSAIFGSSYLAKIIYLLVLISGIYLSVQAYVHEGIIKLH